MCFGKCYPRLYLTVTCCEMNKFLYSNRVGPTVDILRRWCVLLNFINQPDITMTTAVCFLNGTTQRVDVRYDTIRYGRLTCAQELTRWPA